MNRTLLFAAVFIAGLGLGVWLRSALEPRHECQEVRTSFNINDPGKVAFLLSRLETIAWQNPGGSVTLYGVEKEAGGPNRNLTLSWNLPLSVPDHHGRQTFTLVDLRDHKAIIGYLNEFDHRSSGRNLRTVDSGVVELVVFRKEEAGGAP